SYLERFDLAHVDPSEGNFDALGKGVEEGRPVAMQLVSKGLTRSRTDRLQVVPAQPDNITAIGGNAARGDAQGSSQTAVALKAEPEAKLSPTEKLEALQWQQPAPSPKAAAA